MKDKILKGKGEVDYDFEEDILFFKTSEREYSNSIEFDNFIIDIDTKGFIVGIQILDASEFLNLSKTMLLKIPKWEFRATFREGIIEIKLFFNVEIRNQIIEKNPIIVTPSSERLPSTELICVAR